LRGGRAEVDKEGLKIRQGSAGIRMEHETYYIRHHLHGLVDKS
jgi:hypothetical protein